MAGLRMPTHGLEMSTPPKDGVTSVKFCYEEDKADLLLISSWDHSVSIHSVSTNTLRYSYDHGAPVLGACFTSGGTEVCSAGLDKTVKKFSVGSEPTGAGGQIIGQHDSPVKCICYVRDDDLLVSGSWDKTVR